MTAKTVITLEHKPFDALIEFTFKKEDTVIRIKSKNTSEARKILLLITRGEKRYKLIQRLL